MSDQSLKSLFSAAEALRRHIESSFGSNPDARQQQISDAVAAYEECRVLADRMSLFSPNETLEDITSGDLQCVRLTEATDTANARKIPLDQLPPG